MLEAHHGVPMCGAVLNTLNTRLDAAALAFILQHGEARALITDTELAPLMREAVRLAARPILVVDVEDPEGPGGAYLLGLRRLGVVPHGRFTRYGISQAILLAARGVSGDVVGRTHAALDAAGALKSPPPAATSGSPSSLPSA